MREIYRPIHSSYETLLLRRSIAREQHFNRSAFPANEQLTALNFDMQSRRQPLFAQGFSR
jgi:hypothetical protein